MVGDASIIKYEDPVLARPDTAFDMTRGHDSLPQYVSLYAAAERRPADPALRVTGAGAAVSGTPRNNRRPNVGGDDNAAIIKAILPNREYVDEAGAWVQAITLQNPERGLLLLRLRDETRMNLDTYAEIYRDSFAFSRRKVEAARQELDGVRSLKTKLESQTSALKAQVRSLEADLTSIDRSNAYAKSIIDREHAETLRLAKEEQKALEAAISKSQKKLKEATPAIGS
eukprot:g14631.t2